MYSAKQKTLTIFVKTNIISRLNFKMSNFRTTILIFTLFFINEIIRLEALPTDSENSLYFRENEIEISDNKINKYRGLYAAKMQTFMNQSMDPCDDFYEYACGNWKNVIEKRPVKQKRNNLLDQSIQIRDAIENILTKAVDNSTELYATELKLAQQFYQSCLSANLYPAKKSEVYLEVLKSIGGFPATDPNWQSSNFSWFNMSSHLSKYGIPSLINEQIIPQYPFPPTFELPTLGLGYIVNRFNIISNTSETYLKNWENMKKLLQMYEVEEPKVTSTVIDIFKFWLDVIKLLNKFKADVEKCIILSQNLQEEPFKEWRNFFDIAWDGTFFDEIEANCPCDYFYRELNLICNDNKEAVANYLALNFLYKMHADIEEKKYQKEYCILTIHKSLPFITDTIYMQEHFKVETREEVKSILNKLRESLRHTLKNADWLDETTREEALLKESTLIVRVGKYDNSNITEKIIDEMRHLTFNESSFEENMVILKRFSANITRYLGKHHQDIPNDTKPLEIMLGSQVNAFYYNDDNSINVMAGVLYPPAYHAAWPDSLKYGTLGFLIGHELTHATDSNYDSTGELRNWWSTKSTKIYKERANCFVKHYSDYLIPEIDQHMNGNLTKDENIADANGLREALNAYRREKKLQLQEELHNLPKLLLNDEMPGLNLNSEQLFFLGFAQLWCAAYDERHYWEELSFEHSIDKYRVLGAVTNNEDFSKAYNCTVGSKMNPQTEKCRLW